MKVISKFLTADVRIVGVTVTGRTIVVEGLVKGFMPMTVEMSPGDAVEMLRAVTLPVRRRLAARLPDRLGALVAPDAAGAAEGEEAAQ